jgi:hypothetical protein
VVVEPVRMPEIVYFGSAGVYRHPSPYPYDAALFGCTHARLAGQIRKWTLHPDRVPGGEWSRGAWCARLSRRMMRGLLAADHEMGRKVVS